MYCHSVHGAIAAAHLDGDEELVRRVKADFQAAAISAKLKCLLSLQARCTVEASACTTVMWTAWQPYSDAMKPCVGSAVRCGTMAHIALPEI